MDKKSNDKACCVYWLFDAGCSTPEISGYIGITSNLSKRIRGHAKSRRFLEFQVKVLFEGSRHECSAMEFNLRPRVGIGWNLGTGGKSTHGTLGKKLSAKTRKKMREAHAKRSLKEKRRLAKIYGQSWIKLNKSRIGKTLSPEHRAKLRVALIGNKNGVGHQPWLGKHLSLEHRQKIADKMKGKQNHLGAKLTAEQRTNISAGRKGKGLRNTNNRKWLLERAARNADGTWKSRMVGD